MLLLLGVMCCPSWLYCTGRFLSLDQRSKIYRISSLFPFTLALLQIYTFTQYLSYSLIIYLIKKKTFRISFELKAPLKCREWVCEAYIFCTTHVCFRYVSVCEGFQLPQWQDWLRMQENPNWGQSVTAADEIEKLHFLFTLFNSFFLEGGGTLGSGA